MKVAFHGKARIARPLLLIRLLTGFLLAIVGWADATTAAQLQWTGSTTLQATADSLRGEVTLRLTGSPTVKEVEIYAIEGGNRQLLQRQDQWISDTEILVPVNLPRLHEYPGRYQLLLEARFFGADSEASSLNTVLPYLRQEMSKVPSLPLLQIQGERLIWPADIPPGEFVGLDLSLGPHWNLRGPVSPGDDDLSLVQQEPVRKIAAGHYQQLAVLNWLDTDGIHHSRVIPWTIEVDRRGDWSGSTPTLAWISAPSALELAWLLLLIITASASYIAHRKTRPALVQRIWGIAMLLGCVLWLAHYTQPDLWFTVSWPTGGDIASHVLYIDRFRDWLFDGKTTGWMPEVFSGLPAFRFYFPLPFALIALLSVLVPIQIASKIVIILPTLVIPLAVYWMVGKFGWRQGARLFAGLFSIGFLLHEGSTVWGGNALAVLAGEFSYSWGMLFMLLFWGALYSSLRDGGHRWVAPALLLAMTGLSHGYPLLVAGFSALLMPLLFAQWQQALFTVLRVHLVAFLVIGFWLLPLIENLPYTVPNDTAEWATHFDSFLPATMRVLLLALPALIYLLYKPSEARPSLVFLLVTAMMAAMAYLGAWAVGLADIRFFPFVQLCLAIALGCALGEWLQQRERDAAHWGFAIVSLLFIHLWLGQVEKLAGWSKWAFEGYEQKVMWKHYRALADHLAGGTDEPRILFEHDPANNDLGSTRTLEALPLFGSRPVMEGLYMESAVSGPYIYQLQAEVSSQPSSPMSRFPSVRGTAPPLESRLMDAYIDTLVVRSKGSAMALEQNSAFEKTGQFGPLQVFRLKQRPTLVEVQEELVLRDDDRRWMEQSFRDYVLAESAPARLVFAREETLLGDIKEMPDQVVISDLQYEAEHISFITNAPGTPHLVRITYHPAWRSIGGETLHKASPAFMLLVPDSQRVTLEFGSTPGQALGKWFSLAGLVLLLIPIANRPALQTRLHLTGTRLVALVITTLAMTAYLYHPSRQYFIGHDLFAQQDYAAAAEKFEIAVKKRKVRAQWSEASFWAARNFEMAGDIPRAKEFYRQIISETPHSYWVTESLYRLAKLHESDGSEERDNPYATRLLQYFPGNQWAVTWRREQERMKHDTNDS